MDSEDGCNYMRIMCSFDGVDREHSPGALLAMWHEGWTVTPFSKFRGRASKQLWCQQTGPVSHMLASGL